jgi:hypothetical protein
MTNPSKRKGSLWERRIAEWLRGHGFLHAERRALEGVNDRGDIAGIPGIVVECKNHKTWALSEWMDELQVEKRNANSTHGIVVIPRRSHPVDRAYVVMELGQWADLFGDREIA